MSKKRKRRGAKRRRNRKHALRRAPHSRSEDEFEYLGVRVRREGKHVLWETTDRFDRERLAANFGERSRNAAAIVDQLWDRLLSTLVQVSPLHLVGQVAAWATAGIPNEDDAAERLGAEAQVEYLAGLALSLQERSPELATPHAVQTTLKLLADLFEAEEERMVGAEIAAAGKTDDPPDFLEEARFVLLLEQLVDRMQGYVQHLDVIVSALFEPIREECTKEIGFCPADFPKLVRAYVVNRQELFKARLEKARKVSDEELEGLSVPLGYAQVSWAIFGVADPSGNVTAAELARVTDLPVGEVMAALEALVSEWGTQPEFRHPKQRNSFRRYPVLRGESGRYSIPLPWSILHEAIPWALDYFRRGKHEDLLSRFYECRSQVSEELVARTLAEVFGEDRVLRNIEYPIAGQNWAEADLLVSLGQHALVVETKSHGVSDEYRAGDLDRARFHFSDLVETPFRQSYRAAEYLLSGGTKLRRQGTNERIDWQPVRTITRIVVSLERIDPLVMVATRSKERTEGPPPAWVLCLTDLLMIRDILPTPHAFLVYAALKSMLAANPVSALISEGDALGAFLQDRLQDYLSILGKPNLDVASLSHHAQDLNAYYSANAAGLLAAKPGLSIAPEVLDELNHLYEEMSPDWPSRAIDAIVGTFIGFSDLMSVPTGFHQGSSPDVE